MSSRDLNEEKEGIFMQLNEYNVHTSQGKVEEDDGVAGVRGDGVHDGGVCLVTSEVQPSWRMLILLLWER